MYPDTDGVGMQFTLNHCKYDLVKLLEVRNYSMQQFPVSD